MKLKKLAIVLVGFVFLLLAAILILPFVIDVDQYRPQIVDAANQRINGKLEMGKLRLSLWGQIRVQVEGVELKDAQSRPVVSVKDSYFHVPFSSVLSGEPVLTFKMHQPELNVIKDASGKLNVMSLVKTEAAEQPAPTAPTAPAPSSTTTQSPTTVTPPAQPVAIPAIATRARLGVEISDARLSYRDVPQNATTEIKNLNLEVKNISLSHPIELKAWADLDTRMGKDLIVKGPAKIEARAQTQVAGAKISEVSLQAKVDLDELDILMPGLFHKAKGVAARAEAILQASPREARIEKFDAKFHNAEIQVAGTLSNLSGEGAQTSPIVNLQMKSNPIDLKPWSKLIPMLVEYELGGQAHFDANLMGPAEKLGYAANLTFKDLTAKAPGLKVQPTFQGAIKIVTDQIESLLVTMSAPGNDLKLQGKVVSFTQPRVDLTLTSNGMDFDQLIEFAEDPAAPAAPKSKSSKTEKKKPEAKKAESPATTLQGSAPTEKPPSTDGTPSEQAKTPPQGESDFDAMLEPLRQNPIAAATQAKATVSFKSLKSRGITMTDLQGKMSLKDLVASIDDFKMGIWGGTIQAKMSSQLKPKAPTYRFSSEIKSLDLQKAVTTQMPLLKNTIVGQASMKIDGAGTSFNPEPAKRALDAKGTFLVENATFATIDVGKMASEAINQAIDKLAARFPQIQGKKLNIGGGRESKYDQISSDFKIDQAKFSAPNFVAKAAAGQGIDLRGTTTVGIIDYSLKAHWELIDTHNFTHLKDIGIEQNGIKVDSIFSPGPNQPVKFPVKVGCTVFAPCFTYTEVPEYLANLALKNTSQALEGKAKAELQKKLDEAQQKLKDQIPQDIKDKAKDIRKKLFGR